MMQDKKMRVLIACEESQIVCKAFRARGHEAYSCDIQECSGGHPEWHIQDDCRVVACEPWDLMIAHPPCTYLSRVGIQYNKRPGRLQLRDEAIAFFLTLKNNPHIPKICLENPVPQEYVTNRVGRWSQIIQPYYYGDNHMKTTCLWLKGLSRLNGLHEVALEPKRYKPMPLGFNGRGNPYYISGLLIKEKERAKMRSKTFPGIAKAMAEQWSPDLTITTNNQKPKRS